MAIVQHDRDSLDVEQVEACWDLVEARFEGFEAGRELGGGYSQGPGRCRRRQKVLNVEADASAASQRRSRQGKQRDFVVSLGEDDPAVACKNRPPALPPMLDNDGMVGRTGKIADRA